MSYSNGPKIVTDGLKCCLDAANLKCYPKTGATVYDLSGTVGSFTGNASYISSDTGFAAGAGWSCSTTDILNTDFHSMFFKVRFNSTETYPNGVTGGWEKIFTYAPAGTDRSPGIWRWPNNRWIHWRYDPSNTGTDFGKAGSSLDTGNEFDLNKWYYVGVTKSGSNTVMYVNGIQVGTGAVSYPKVSGTASVTLFENYTNPLCNIDNLTIYNRVVSGAEVLQNYNALKSRFGLS